MSKNRKLTLLQSKQLQLLKETRDYYSVVPGDRRCVTQGGSCVYSPDTTGKTTSQGCAVGRLIPIQLANKIDNESDNQGVDEIYNLLPQYVQEYGLPYLSNLQHFHDYERYWGQKGLSDKGLEYYEKMRSKVINQDF